MAKMSCVNHPRCDRPFQPTVKLQSPSIGLYSHLVITATFNLSSLYSYAFFYLLKIDLSDQLVYSAYDHILKFHALCLCFTSRKGIQSNLGFLVLDARLLSVEREFQIPIVIRITDSDSKKKKNSRIFHSTSKNLPDSGIQISLHGAMYSFIGSLGKERSVELNLGERKGTSLI